MKVSDYISEFLYAQGVTHVFEVLGGMTTHLIDSLHQHGKIRIVSTHHEQAAAFAADGIARITGVPGVAIGTSGPGATNLLTGIASCHFDSVPAVFLTGQVNRSEQKGDRAIRQLGFQETDIVAMAMPITKAAWQARTAEELPALLQRAFALALSGRPGPVLIDIPMDLQYAQISVSAPQCVVPLASANPAGEDILQMRDALHHAQRPMILAGGGIRAARAQKKFREFVDQVRVPVVNSLLAVDALPYAHPLRVGMIGTYGNRWANVALGNSDFLLVLGSRLDIRQTGADTQFLETGRMIYHIDCEPAEINNRVTGCRPIVADLNTFLTIVTNQADEFPTPTDWLAQIKAWRETWRDTAELQDVAGINPNEFLHQLAITSRGAAAYVADVGQHQMWAAQSLELEPHQHFLTSAGMGAMGAALPMAIGAAMACSAQPIVTIVGDGGFQLNIQELQTVARNQLPIKIVVLNNHCYGMVRQFQETYFDARYPSSIWGYSAPDYVRVAQAYDLSATRISDPSEISRGLNEMWADPHAPFLLDVNIHSFTNAYPKIAFGRPLTEMEPLAKPVEMEGT